MSNAPLKGSIWYHFKHDPLLGVNHMAYQIIGLAIDTSTEKLTVIYRALYNILDTDCESHGEDFYTRPLEQWYEVIKFKDKLTARFREVLEPQRSQILQISNKRVIIFSNFD